MHKAFWGIWSIADSILFILRQHLLCLQNYQKQSCHNCHQRMTMFPWKSTSYIWHSLSSLLWEPFAEKRNGKTIKWDASCSTGLLKTSFLSLVGLNSRRDEHTFFFSPYRENEIGNCYQKFFFLQLRSNSQKGSLLENISMIFINLSKHLQLLLFPPYSPKHSALYWTPDFNASS